MRVARPLVGRERGEAAPLDRARTLETPRAERPRPSATATRAEATRLAHRATARNGASNATTEIREAATPAALLVTARSVAANVTTATPASDDWGRTYVHVPQALAGGSVKVPDPRLVTLERRVRADRSRILVATRATRATHDPIAIRDARRVLSALAPVVVARRAIDTIRVGRREHRVRTTSASIETVPIDERHATTRRRVIDVRSSRRVALDPLLATSELATQVPGTGVLVN